VEYPEIHGGGDCIAIEGKHIAKVGVHAVREGPVLYRNVMAALEDGEPGTYEPVEGYLLILNMGDGTGIAQKAGKVAGGRWVFTVKDFIDRRFVRKYVPGRGMTPFTL
jgi:NADH dehydrogenase FAD-containing subunit